VNHLTAFGETVRIEIKGDIRDVTKLTIDGTDYPLTSGGINVYNITEGGQVIGTITKGSAVITLPPAFSDRFANGTYQFEIFFTDITGTGSGKADLIVNRSAGTGETGNGSGAIVPNTGDETPINLLFALSFLSLCCLLGLLLLVRRRVKAANR
jgi:hypothetical protein